MSRPGSPPDPAPARAPDGAPPAAARIDVLGVRHHCPACARLVRRSLDACDPDIVLLEGPPEAAGRPLSPEILAALVPPVALLVWPDAAPDAARAFPLARFSPEWVALEWARSRGREARFIDLPRALWPSAEPPRMPEIGPTSNAWWIDRVAPLAFGPRRAEARPDEIFARIAAAAADLRDAYPEPMEHFALREAWMRAEIRRAARAAPRIAVLCGALHAPALEIARHRGVASADAARIAAARRAQLGRRPLAGRRAAWVPWRLEALRPETGGGPAGIPAPGWSAAVWATDGRETDALWTTAVARELRREGFDLGPADAVAAADIARELGATRGVPFPGPLEIEQGCAAAFSNAPAGAVTARARRLSAGIWSADAEISGRLGPAEGRAPLDMAALGPVAADLERRRLRLRLPNPIGGRETCRRLDLRTPRGREIAVLLRRLELLGLRWARPDGPARSGGAVERWRFAPDAGDAGALLAAAALGRSVAVAAAETLRRDCAAAADPARLLYLWREARAADLPDAARCAETALCERAPGALAARLRALGTLAIEHGGEAPLTPIARGLVAWSAIEPDSALALLETIEIGLPRPDRLALLLRDAPAPELSGWAEGLLDAPAPLVPDPRRIRARLGPDARRLADPSARRRLICALDAMAPEDWATAAPLLSAVLRAAPAALRRAAAKPEENPARAFSRSAAAGLDPIASAGDALLERLLGPRPKAVRPPEIGAARLREALRDAAPVEPETACAARSPDAEADPCAALASAAAELPRAQAARLLSDAAQRLGPPAAAEAARRLSALPPREAVRRAADLAPIAAADPAAAAVLRRAVEPIADRVIEALEDWAEQAADGLDAPPRSPAGARGAIDWRKTIHANLRTYAPDRRALALERIRRKPAAAPAPPISLLIDLSGSMGPAAVEAALFAAAVARAGRLAPRLIAFDHRPEDLTELQSEPDRLLDRFLFERAFGGGTDLAAALDAAGDDGPTLLISDLGSAGERAPLAAALERRRVAGGLAVLRPADTRPDPGLARLFERGGALILPAAPHGLPELMVEALRTLAAPRIARSPFDAHL